MSIPFKGNGKAQFLQHFSNCMQQFKDKEINAETSIQIITATRFALVEFFLLPYISGSTEREMSALLKTNPIYKNFADEYDKNSV